MAVASQVRCARLKVPGSMASTSARMLMATSISISEKPASPHLAAGWRARAHGCTTSFMVVSCTDRGRRVGPVAPVHVHRHPEGRQRRGRRCRYRASRAARPWSRHSRPSRRSAGHPTAARRSRQPPARPCATCNAAVSRLREPHAAPAERQALVDQQIAGDEDHQRHQRLHQREAALAAEPARPPIASTAPGHRRSTS